MKNNKNILMQTPSDLLAGLSFFSLKKVFLLLLLNTLFSNAFSQGLDASVEAGFYTPASVNVGQTSILEFTYVSINSFGAGVLEVIIDVDENYYVSGGPTAPPSDGGAFTWTYIPTGDIWRGINNVSVNEFLLTQVTLTVTATAVSPGPQPTTVTVQRLFPFGQWPTSLPDKNTVGNLTVTALPDTDGDGNPNGTDPNPTVPTAVNDTTNAPFGVTTSIDILANDDFLPNDGNTITEISGGTAGGTKVFDPITGELDYTPLPSEAGTIVTVIYEVCQGTVCDQATVIITVSAALLPDYTSNHTFLQTVFDLNQQINFISNINELSNESTIGTLEVFIPNMAGYSINYDGSLTTLEVGGVVESVNNSDWVHDTSVTTGLLLRNSNNVSPNDRSRIGYTLTSNSVGAEANITTTIQAATGGDTNNTNNTGALNISTQNSN